MKTIIFNEQGEAVSDFKISQYVDNIINSEATVFNVSTQLVIDEMRARINEKKINTEDFKFIVGIHDFVVDKDGRSRDWKPCQEVAEKIMIRLC